jgi:propanol-preferring alcohol dehydrogenase
MTRTQSGYRVHHWGAEPLWEEFARPTVGANEVLVEVEACGVGLTVLNCINGDLSDDDRLLPRVPGHELVGRVIEAGPGEGGRLAGRQVAAYFYLVCGECEACVAGRDSNCANLGGWLGVHRDGGYAPLASLPVRNVIALPEGIDPVAGTVIPDALATSVHVCFERARIRPGERVAVLGAGGGVGIHMVQVARLCGAEVFGFDVHEQKLSMLEELGVRSIDSSDFDVVTRTWRGRPPDMVVDLLGTELSMTWALDALGERGRLVVLTTFRGVASSVAPRDIVLGELSIVGSKYASRANVRTAADLVARELVKPIIGRVGPARDVLSMHEQLRSGLLIGRGALRW